MSFVPLVRSWIWISVLASAAGWTLSAVGQLNRAGYLVFFAVAAVVWIVKRKWKTLERVDEISGRAGTSLNRGVNESGAMHKPKGAGRPFWNWRKILWRFRHMRMCRNLHRIF